ncbi:hypothetical protein [Pseudoalteromonas ruthenica]|uniref:hypothetical protein n=1 Tax=Pseudoalteromonas ruthenica TaxID=151081 RepID=UPI00124864C5|nr:hypothetical protein [Pseudoalteromonas ruthenica]
MNYLHKGQLSLERLELLFRLTKIASEDVRAALVDHYVRGMKQADAALLNNVPAQNVKRGAERLNQVAAVVEEIKELDWGARGF